MANFNFFLNRQGIQGRKGEKGDTGFSPTISVGTDTLDEYKLIIANESNSFETPNLRGNINIQDNGGTYLRYDTETKQISAQSIDAATADTLGGVRLSTEADIVEMSAYSVVTPSDVADALPLYLEGEGAVTITQDELTSKTKIKVDVSSVNDLESRMSTAEAEIADIQTDVADLNNNKVAKTDLATTESAGIVKVDGTSITVTADGTISAVAGGGSAPANMVTTDTEQTITANKTFSASSVVTFGDGNAKTTIERNTVKLGGDNYDIALLPGVMTDKDGTQIDAGIITSKVGTINIVPDAKTQDNGDGVVIQKNSFRFNKNEVVTKSASDNEYMAHMAMPSNRTVYLTIGASGTDYTAPADGYFCFCSYLTTKAGQECRLITRGEAIIRQSGYSSGAKQYIEVVIPVSKGQSVGVYYTAPAAAITFTYAEGAPSA